MLWQVFVPFLVACSCQAILYNELSDYFTTLNDEVLGVNHQTAQLAWDTNFNLAKPDISIEVQYYAELKRNWLLKKCSEMRSSSSKFSNQQERIYDRLCHGTKFTPFQQKKLIELSNLVERIYTSTRLCVPKALNICREPEKFWNATFFEMENEVHQLMFSPDEGSVEIFPSMVAVEDLTCFKGEPDLERLMANDFSAFSFDVALCDANKNLIDYWSWEAWRLSVGPVIKGPYLELADLMNDGAKSSGFDNIGELWKNEMDFDEDVDELMERLMAEVQPLYNMLHAFMKSLLQKKNRILLGKNLPAHILGWNANWFHLFKDLVAPEIFKTSWNMDEALKNTKWDSTGMIKRVEDFYTSTGLKRMTQTFWNKSVLGDNGNINCHGTAADMFKTDDFRVVVCGGKSLYDFYVLIHEMGHIEQYMLTEKQLGVFRAGNSVVQETIGDVAFLAMMTPMHLNRLGLIDDAKLFPSTENNFDLHQLMTLAFMKLPEIPFGYVFEKFRNDLFAKRVDVEQSNDYFWELTRKYQRIEPANSKLNRHQLFDASAKFHFAANVPYARYFFANILQYQVFRGLCEKTFYGKLNSNQSLPLPLHKCDIYGSKRAGNLLKQALQPGSSLSLKKVLITLTGSDKISADALKEFYNPLEKWLRRYLESNRIEY